MGYYAFRMKPDEPERPRRAPRQDWLELSMLEQKAVLMHKDKTVAYGQLPVRAQAYVRRHCREAE